MWDEDTDGDGDGGDEDDNNNSDDNINIKNRVAVIKIRRYKDKGTILIVYYSISAKRFVKSEELIVWVSLPLPTKEQSQPPHSRKYTTSLRPVGQPAS